MPSVRVPQCQKLQMTGLTRSGTGCFIAVSIWQQLASGAIYEMLTSIQVSYTLALVLSSASVANQK